MTTFLYIYIFFFSCKYIIRHGLMRKLPLRRVNRRRLSKLSRYGRDYDSTLICCTPCGSPTDTFNTVLVLYFLRQSKENY